MGIIKTLFEQILSVFFPFRCHSCQSSCEFGIVLCNDCQEKLRESISYPKAVKDTSCDFTLYTMADYKSFAAEAIKIIKYRPSEKLAVSLALAAIEKADLKNFLNGEDVIIPVPMHEKRLKERGFNQAEVLAKNYAEKLGCKYSPAIVRKRFTKPQASCSEEERLTNLENAFALVPALDKEAFYNRRLVIVDDVATTGTTLSKCAAPLKELRPKEIIALVVAHSYLIKVEEGERIRSRG